MPDVSVIIPAYNAAGCVARAVESALMQTGCGVEVIVVDDGSSDATWEVLGAFGDRVRRLRQANAGPGAARNNGCRHATGDWVAFLDADDVWLPDKLRRQLALADGGAGLIYGDCLYLDAAGAPDKRQSDFHRLDEGDVFEGLLESNPVPLSCAMMHRERWFAPLGGFDEDRALFGVEDWDLWLRFAAAGGRARVCPEVLAHYHVTPGSLSKGLDRMHAARLRVLRRALGLPRARSVPPSVVHRAYFTALTWSAWDAVQDGRRARALAWYLCSAWHRPWHPEPYKGIVRCFLPARRSA